MRKWLVALFAARRKEAQGVSERIDRLEARDKRSRVRADVALRRAYQMMDDRLKPTHRLPR
jgi:hypothetical protein